MLTNDFVGCSCDWDREQFSLSDKMSETVQETFKKLQEDDLIYKGEYMVNWCPRCKTALSEDEVEHQEQHTKLYYIKYFHETSTDSIVIATTRPETILGDTAVVFHPEDDRFNSCPQDLNVKVPLIDRVIPCLRDKSVKLDFGSGVLKVTPAHDKNDHEIGKRHKLPIIDILSENAKINFISKYKGMDRYQCREEIVKDLTEAGHMVHIEPYTNNIGICYRCKTTLEPRISEQYFVRMEPLRKRALEIIESGEVKLIPEHHKKIFTEWMSKDVDWCISRQLWWGHQIPESEDVLDTWFSSALWAFSVFDSPEEESYFAPTDVLMTGADILFFWVAR